MDFPFEIRNMTETAALKYDIQTLKNISQSITDKYKNNSGSGKRLVVTSAEAAVYAVVRMPATFAAVSSAFSHVLQTTNLSGPYSLLDVGAGTGAGTFAISSLTELSDVTCIERENEMRQLGQSFMKHSSQSLHNAKWISSDLLSGLTQKADIVLSSYVLNEMTEQNCRNTVQMLWEHTEKMLLIVEPGTPESFSRLLKIRSQLLSYGAFIAAPCVHNNDCPLSESDWCHFTARVQRSKLHKLIKNADVPYEDEKFSYLAAVREMPVIKGKRILRHPVTAKGNIRLSLCTDSGYQNISVTKKDKDSFKSARKADCGDLWI